MDGGEVTWRALITNEVLWLAGAAWAVSAIIKVLITVAVDRKLLLVRLIGSGGMPSTHTAPVLALTTAVALIYGLNHPYFAFGVVLSFLVVYDAANLRHEAGRHAEAINILFEELKSKGRLRREKWKRMSELMGHTPVEIFVGGLIGVLVALLGHNLWGIYVVG